VSGSELQDSDGAASRIAERSKSAKRYQISNQRGAERLVNALTCICRDEGIRLSL